MATELDDFRQRTLADMRRVYTEMVADHATHPRNTGSIADADGFASITTVDGDAIRMWLRVEDDRVVAATFLTRTCAATVASLSMLSELIRGRTVAGAMAVGQREVLEALGGLPEGNVHCARLAVDTLRAALRDYLAVKKEPWRKSYRQYGSLVRENRA